MSVIDEPQVLRPFHRSEVLSIAEAACIAGRAVRTIREWCLFHDIGRRIGGRWAVSKGRLGHVARWQQGDPWNLSRRRSELSDHHGIFRPMRRTAIKG